MVIENYVNGSEAWFNLYGAGEKITLLNDADDIGKNTPSE